MADDEVEWAGSGNVGNGSLPSVDPSEVGSVILNDDGSTFVKRKPGRPRKDGSSAQPRNGETSRSAGSVGGSSKKQASSSEVLKPEALSPGIMAVHMVLAAKVPEFAMSQAEADQLSIAVCNYLRHTKFSLTEKQKDFGALIMALAMIEGTRIIAALKGAQRRRDQASTQEAVREASARNGQIVQLQPGAFPGVM